MYKLRNEKWIFQRINISANQMIKGDSKGVDNRHVWFGYITKSGEGCNSHYTFKAFP